VQFFDGAVSLGIVALSGGTASLTTSALAVGTHFITVRYGGDARLHRQHVFARDADSRSGHGQYDHDVDVVVESLAFGSR